MLNTPFQVGRIVSESAFDAKRKVDLKKKEERKIRAEKLKKQKAAHEAESWAKFKGSIRMWGLVFMVLIAYFMIVGICLQNIREYPYTGYDKEVQNPEFTIAVSLLVIGVFTLLMYRFYIFLRS